MGQAEDSSAFAADAATQPTPPTPGHTEPPARRSAEHASTNTVTIAVAVIGLVSAILSAVLPIVLSGRDEPPAMLALTSSGVAPIAATAVSVLPDLTLGIWTITDAVDDEGADWGNSTLKFTSQTPTPGGAQLQGFFEWRTGGRIVGREHVIATLDGASRRLFLEGQYTEAITGQLATGSFSAQLSPDGLRLADGAWGSTPGNLPAVRSTWRARR